VAGVTPVSFHVVQQQGDPSDMGIKKIAVGIAAWFLGIIVPVMHHVLLHWPLAAQRTSNTITRSQSVFRDLPWIDWAYLIAMGLVGLALINSGFKSCETDR
jgi:hypothetical protein